VTAPSSRRIEREDKDFARCRLPVAREESLLTDRTEREAPVMNTIGTHPLNQHHLIRAALAATVATLLLGALQVSPAGDPPATPTSMNHHRFDY
jgi:hypothetical protein